MAKQQTKKEAPKPVKMSMKDAMKKADSLTVEGVKKSGLANTFDSKKHPVISAIARFAGARNPTQLRKGAKVDSVKAENIYKAIDNSNKPQPNSYYKNIRDNDRYNKFLGEVGKILDREKAKDKPKVTPKPIPYTSMPKSPSKPTPLKKKK